MLSYYKKGYIPWRKEEIIILIKVRIKAWGFFKKRREDGK